jgi:hypothetical protein
MRRIPKSGLVRFQGGRSVAEKELDILILKEVAKGEF